MKTNAKVKEEITVKVPFTAEELLHSIWLNTLTGAESEGKKAFTEATD